MTAKITTAMGKAGAKAIRQAMRFGALGSSHEYLARKAYRAMEAARAPTCLCTPAPAASTQVDAVIHDAEALTQRPSRDSET